MNVVYSSNEISQSNCELQLPHCMLVVIRFLLLDPKLQGLAEEVSHLGCMGSIMPPMSMKCNRLTCS